MKFPGWAVCFSMLLSSHLSAVCQDDASSPDFNATVVQPYINNNNLFKEQIYVHFNKSCYLPGDDIWFSTYITDPLTGLLNPYTRNLYVELYDTKGKMLGQKILPVSKGIANSMFSLSDKILPGHFTFRTYTNWMKNFCSTEEFDRFVEVIGEDKNQFTPGNPEFDVQFFAESGTLLSGVFNKIAVKALDANGKSAVLNGVVMDNNNDSVASITMNKMGMGEFILFPLKNSTYKAKFMLPEGQTQIFNLPRVESIGVVATAVSRKDKILFEIRSNDETIDKEKLFYILVHSNGNVYHSLSTKLTSQRNSITFSINRQDAGNGVNCLTLFDENFQPVAERLFYNKKTNIKGTVEFEQGFIQDSVQLNLTVANNSAKPHLSFLSISVLPEGTISNKFNNSLLADVLLKSGVRGNIENPQYYFEDDDAAHSKALELLLLTQGWRKYDWKNLISTDHEYPNKFENGFSITGFVKNWLNGKGDKSGSISLLSPENKLFSISQADSSGRYAYTGLFLSDSSRVILSASNAKGKSWNRTISASIEPDYQVYSIINVKPYVFTGKKGKDTIPPLKLLPGVIELPEFVITATQKTPFNESIYVSSFDNSYEITKENYGRYHSIELLLMSVFNVRLTIDMEGNYIVDMGRGSKTSQPKLIIDDIEVSEMSYLSMYTIDQIEAISVNKNGNAIVGDGGAIILKTRKDAINWGSTTPTNMKILTIKGFSPPVAYYTPKYLQTPDSETYQKYASVFWKPDIVTDSKGITSLRFSVPKELKVFNMRTEGISEDGTIYLDERKITIKP